MNNEHSLFDQAKLDLDAAKEDLNIHKAEVQAAQARYNDSLQRHNEAMQRFLQADLSRVCRWNQMYHKLVQWKQDNDGDTIVPTYKDSSDDVKKLAKW